MEHLIDSPLYNIVEPRVASGEWGGGDGAVCPAVGDDGPQHDDDAVTTVVFPVATAAAGASPTTSISSSSSKSRFGSSARSGHGYAFHFFAIKHRGIVHRNTHAHGNQSTIINWKQCKLTN